MGGINITIQPGYYRSPNPETVIIVACNDSQTRCLGGVGYTNCEDIYSGPVCLQCNTEGGYISNDEGECSHCYSFQTLVTFVVLIYLSAIVYQGILVVNAYRGAKVANEYYNSTSEQQSRSNYKIRISSHSFMIIFSTFAQIASILSEKDTALFKQYTGITSILANTTQQALLSLKCLIHLRWDDPFDSIEVQLLIVVFVPLIKIAAVIAFEFLNYICCRKTTREKSIVRIGTISVVIIFLEQPGIIGFLGNYLSCNQLDPNMDTKYITTSNNIECYTPQYTHVRNTIIIPALMFWGVVVPFGIVLVLKLNQSKLYTSKNFQTVLGHLYLSYSQKAYYWGILLLIVRMSVFIVDALLTQYQEIKILILLFFFHVYLKFHFKVTPYFSKSLQQAEKLTIYVYVTILTLQLFQLVISIDKLNTTLSALMMVLKILMDVYILFHVFFHPYK